MTAPHLLDRTPGIVPPAELAARGGLAALRAMIAGELPPPPFSRTARIWLIAAEEGFAAFEGEPSEAFLNPLGTVHGGWTGAILNSAMACAVHTRLAPGQSYTTLEMKVSFLRAVTPRIARVRCEGRIVHFGRRTAVAEGRAVDAATGALLAHGTETCLVMEAPGPA